ncbi:glmZ(sRNA)-inactivating NTPase [Weeksella virosa]|uniref:RapZ C-terminal domain-containing protein n=1 Tax=Weeksella virosa TaxID=1014 RepID=UPI000DFA574D|nr:RNase adapter RapZ [Weeksella virosa]SUP54921.1 glmZ(sRNA)-inactivating NTPase [Weeksella virosa]
MVTPLNINVRSFSYKREIPKDSSGNGGGFVFDCRGILNPGRFDQYKTLTGRDQEVITFLEDKTKAPVFLEGVKKVISISIEDYIDRNFNNLEINFGCTGGQHRSVYCADQIAMYIKTHYPSVQVNVQHIVQEEKNWINLPY